MQRNPSKFFKWAQKYSIQEACLEELNWCYWKNGLICPKCGHDKFCQLKHRYRHGYTKCVHQFMLTVDHMRLPLPIWFAAIYLMVDNNGKISAERYFWATANRMLRNLCQYLGDRCRLEGLVERVNSGQFREFWRHILLDSAVSTDAIFATRNLGKSHRYEPKAISSKKVDEWIPKVRIVVEYVPNRASITYG